MTEYTNEKTVNVKMTRGELCRLLIALTCIAQDTKQQTWNELHDKLISQLEAFDEAHGIGTFEK